MDTLALTLIRAGHLLFVSRGAKPVDAEAVRKVVTSVIAGALPGFRGGE